MKILEPIVRADFQVINTYEYQNTVAMDIPISVIIGSEESISFRQAQLWQKETIVKIKVNEFKGDHFFIFDHAEEIMELIYSRLTENVVQAPAICALAS